MRNLTLYILIVILRKVSKASNVYHYRISRHIFSNIKMFGIYALELNTYFLNRKKGFYRESIVIIPLTTIYVNRFLFLYHFYPLIHRSILLHVTFLPLNFLFFLDYHIYFFMYFHVYCSPYFSL